MTLDEILSSGKPYFGDFLIAEQGPYKDYVPYFDKLIHIACPPWISWTPTILEIGSWAGGSLNVWNKASGHLANFIVIDQWVPYLNDPESECHQVIDQAARSGQIEQLFRHNMKVLGIDKRLRVIKGSSRQVLPQLANDSVDIAFIDGDHRYGSVKMDILETMPLVREGGVICGDDLQIQLDDHAFDIDEDLLDEHRAYVESNRPNAHLKGVFYHPGVTQAVAEVFGTVSTSGRIWAMQKVGGFWKPIE